MTTALIAKLRLQIDDWRVQQHFKRAELILRKQDVSHLPLHQQHSREHYLDMLHEYATRGVFPRNHERPGISPCFIDRDGRECAVAHLVMRSGHDEFAHRIAIMHNYATVPQIDNPELDEWGSQAGLSREELTLIQPGYWFTLSDILPMVLTAWLAGMITIAVNTIFIIQKRTGIVVPIAGVIATIALLFVGLNCLDGAFTAYFLATGPHDGVLSGNPLPDVAPLALGFVISAGLAWLTVRLSVYRIRVFIKAVHHKS